MLNTDKELKLYYSIGEVADMFGVNPSLLRFWEKEFPQISPKTAGRGIRQYRKEVRSCFSSRSISGVWGFIRIAFSMPLSQSRE